MVQIRTAHTRKQDATAAVGELQQQLDGPDKPSLILFYCSSELDLPGLETAFKATWPDTPVVGCPTAGELGPLGYADRSLVGVAFPAAQFDFVPLLLEGLSDRSIQDIRDQAENARQQLYQHRNADLLVHHFALLLIDGLSLREEPVTRALQNTLPGIPIIGGSAGDSLHFEQTLVFHNGQFHDDCALVLLAGTSCGLHPFKVQHFEATAQRMVVTGADIARRRVTEINGLPAAGEYARLTGVDVDNLNPMRFASAPVVVLINGREYVRSIQQANADDSLTFYCAIEEGLVFRVARGVDIVNNLQNALENETRDLKPQAILAFDCVLRKLEVEQKALRPAYSELLRQYNVVGFNSYGEQYNGIHVNQTFTGLAIGRPEEPEVGP